ncbi:hypothetical protein GCM10010431_84740 [Streptomyces kunmingensis]
MLTPGGAVAVRKREVGDNGVEVSLQASGDGESGQELAPSTRSSAQPASRMRTVMPAAGLRPEATLRELFHTRGAWHDVTTYAALAHEWIPTATAAEQAILAEPAILNGGDALLLTSTRLREMWLTARGEARRHVPVTCLGRSSQGKPGAGAAGRPLVAGDFLLQDRHPRLWLPAVRGWSRAAM